MDEARRVTLNALRWGADVKKGREIIAAAKLGRDSLAARRAREPQGDGSERRKNGRILE